MTSNADDQKAMNFLVSGRVQGVCYRMATVDEARRLGLKGWVRNLPGGDVEVYACGSRGALAELQSWLHEGPPMARVSAVTATDVAIEPFDDFSINY